MLNILTASVNALADRWEHDLEDVSHFLLKFSHKVSLANYYVVATVTSQAPNRTAFTVNTNTTVLPLGDYTYTVYGQDSAVNLDPSLTIGVIKSGIARVRGAVAATYVYYEENDTTPVTYYE